MAISGAKDSQTNWARLAGFLYLFTYVVPITGLTICSHYNVSGNFAETAHRVMSSELFYRFGLSCLLINGVFCILLAMSLYATLKPVDSTLALFGLLFRLTEEILATTLAILSFVAVKAYTSGAIGTTFTPGQLSAGMSLLSQANSVQFNV